MSGPMLKLSILVLSGRRFADLVMSSGIFDFTDVLDRPS
jgi:hypothetical protein